MVKIQKPIPKKFKEKVKLDNPIKKKKDELKKGKSNSVTKNISKRTLEEIPVQKIQSVTKSVKDAAQESTNGKKFNKKQGNQVTKPVVAPKPKELKTNGAVEGKAPKKSQNSSTEPEPTLKVSGKKAGKVQAAKKVSDELQEAVKEVKAKKVVLAPKSSLPKGHLPAKDPEPVMKDSLPPKAKQGKQKLGKKSAPVETVNPAPKQSLPKDTPVEETPKESNPSKVKDGKKKVEKEAAPVEEQKSKAAKARQPDKKIAKLHEKISAKIAALKAKLHPTGEEGEKEEKEEKADGEENPEIKGERKIFRYEPFPYDEKLFDSIVTLENVTKVVDALKTLVQKEIANKKKGIFDDFRYMLQVGCFKIPSCPKRMVKLFLKHPMVEKGDDVLFIVPDLQRGAKFDYEPTKQHYEDLLRPIGLDWITVMPMTQLRKEFVTFEQKRRLIASYDHFLCDGRIVSHVVGMIGKLTQKSRVTLHAVRKSDDLKREIESALNKTAYRQLCKSSLYTIPLATHRFTTQQVAENVLKVIWKLKKTFPGGMGNVRNLYLKIDIIGTSALPLYVSMAKPPEETPYVMGPREKRMLEMKKEANEVLSKFSMTKEGKLVKLTKAGEERKRKLKEMQAALKEEQDKQPKAKKAKKADKEEVKAGNPKKAVTETKKKQKKDEVKELELPENEEDDDETSDDDDEHEVQLGASSDEEESEDMGQFDQEEDDDQGSLEAESDTEILENGLADEDDEESDDDEQEDANTSGGDEDDDDEEDVDDDDDDDDDEEEDDESS